MTRSHATLQGCQCMLQCSQHSLSLMFDRPVSACSLCSALAPSGGLRSMGCWWCSQVVCCRDLDHGQKQGFGCNDQTAAAAMTGQSCEPLQGIKSSASGQKLLAASNKHCTNCRSVLSFSIATINTPLLLCQLQQEHCLDDFLFNSFVFSLN